MCNDMGYYYMAGSTEGRFPSCSTRKTFLFPLICPTLFGRDGRYWPLRIKRIKKVQTEKCR